MQALTHLSAPESEPPGLASDGEPESALVSPDDTPQPMATPASTMAWWSTSWLPLPSIDFSLPSGIQRRFISFILKRSLGHLLKPGQFDVQQIDSQIGSGYVQVRDLELDYTAINSHLIGLPVKLHDGSISSVTARIPWPNPLTANVGLSIQSLHLTFHVDPKAPVPTAQATTNLADSVVSVAESFIHDELTPGEEATLRESFHPDFDISVTSTRENVPGGLDPFIAADEEAPSEVDPAGVSIFATMIERLLSRFEFDAKDTIVTLVYPGHSSFVFKVSEIAYGRDDRPNTTSIDSSTGPKDVTIGPESPGETRTISISGATLLYHDLNPTKGCSSSAHSPQSQLAFNPPISPPSPSAYHYQSDSDLDEDTQSMMSQSIAGLPPRPVSPASTVASTVASTMFQSAVSIIAKDDDEGSTAQTESQDTPPASASELSNGLGAIEQELFPSDSPQAKAPEQEEIQVLEETLLSLACEPTVIRLTTSLLPRRTSAPSFAPSTVAPSVGASSTEGQQAKKSGRVSISITTSTIACALGATHIRSILDIAEILASHTSLKPSPAPKQEIKDSDGASTTTVSSSILDDIKASVHIRGVALLFLPSLLTVKDAKGLPKSKGEVLIDLHAFFDQPLIPPRLLHGYVRLLVETVAVTASVSTSVSRTNVFPAGRSGRQPRSAENELVSSTSTTITLTVADLSICAFRRPSGSPPSPSSSHEHVVSPVLITDPHLSLQYPTEHQSPATISSYDSNHPLQGAQTPPLPVFDVTDWTTPIQHANQARASLWRVKPSHRHNQSRRVSANNLPISSLSPDKVPSANIPPEAPDPNTHEPALTAKVAAASSVIHSGDRTSGRNADEYSVNADFLPLHFFFDLGLMLDGGDNDQESSQLLSFLEEIASPVSQQRTLGSDFPQRDSGSESGGDETDETDPTPPASPRGQRMSKMRKQQREREMERKRLERLVLEDLNLSMDYRLKEPGLSVPSTRSKRKVKSRTQEVQRVDVAVGFPMIRMEVRCPPPPSYSPRSGAFIMDIHGLTLSTHSPPSSHKPGARFTGIDATVPPPSPLHKSNSTSLLTAELRRLVIASSLVGESNASAFMSLGPLSVAAEGSGGGRSTDGGSGLNAHPARIALTQTHNLAINPSKALVLAIEIPSLHIDLSKPLLDGAQLWADDIQQLVERTVSKSADSETSSRQGPSLIGSRFFVPAKHRASSSSIESDGIGLQESKSLSNETIIKATVSEAFVRLMVPREVKDTSALLQPFDILASEVDALLELKPEGKDETVMTLSTMVIVIVDGQSSSSMPSLSLTAPRSLLSSPRPLLKLRFTSLVVPESTAKETRIRLTLCGFTYNFLPDLQWMSDLARFAKSPPGAFESVIPSERTRVTVKVMDGSVRLFAPQHPGALVLHLGDFDFSTDIVGDSTETHLNIGVSTLGVLLVDNHLAAANDANRLSLLGAKGITFWKRSGYALLAEISNLKLLIAIANEEPSNSDVTVEGITLRLHLCADTMTALGAFGSDLGSAFGKHDTEPSLQPQTKEPTNLSTQEYINHEIMASVDEQAFHRIPEVGAAPDMINDDLPSNPEYLDASFGAAAGLREYDDEDLEDLQEEDIFSYNTTSEKVGLISKVGGETIKLLHSEELNVVENYFTTLPALSEEIYENGMVKDRLRIHQADVTLFLYEGYDWASTRQTIEHEIKEMKRRLAKIKQLVASGQTYDPNVDEASTLLFNSVYVGLEQDLNEMGPDALIEAIDEELKDDLETASQSSWQSLKPQTHEQPAPRSLRIHGHRLTRARGPSIEFRLFGLNAEVDQHAPDDDTVSRVLATIRDVEILDHVKTSTWRKFLSALRSDSHGNVRETDSNMVRVELRTVRPVPSNPSEEARLRAKILPLRLHVDQDALDFLKKFFSFKDPNATPAAGAPSNEIYFQHAEVFPVGLKLDYKPRRVDYRALREGRTIELMNFFHFDGAEMTLRHITISGITGWPRFFDLLNDLWTPDVKATQLADVISGVAPIRSVVNVGSGVADLVLLPIAQYKKDGRIVRGIQKGTRAFVQTTAVEAIKLGARLATGTQVILEQAENVLGSHFSESITAETVPESPVDSEGTGPRWNTGEDAADLISKYAEQPLDMKEGMQSAYTSLRRNLNSAAQTILAVPMEVYERSGNEGPVRAVIRAVPIAVLKPMIGASEAVSKALLGLHNSMDPNVRLENEAKYKHRQ